VVAACSLFSKWSLQYIFAFGEKRAGADAVYTWDVTFRERSNVALFFSQGHTLGPPPPQHSKITKSRPQFWLRLCQKSVPNFAISVLWEFFNPQATNIWCRQEHFSSKFFNSVPESEEMAFPSLNFANSVCKNFLYYTTLLQLIKSYFACRVCTWLKILTVWFPT
jgi:hypothetical protein